MLIVRWVLQMHLPCGDYFSSIRKDNSCPRLDDTVEIEVDIVPAVVHVGEEIPLPKTDRTELCVVQRNRIILGCDSA